MIAFQLYRMLAQQLAPLCASVAEGAQATDLWQDKRDSLRRCPAVGLSFRINAFLQAARFVPSLPNRITLCARTLISTSHAFCHGR